ncbi:MAG TPA: hypothetical protein VD962_10700 [Rubricoccaceae bacterium]|nr:hypothetical protein [Rubricoccaceae bacterium]
MAATKSRFFLAPIVSLLLLAGCSLFDNEQSFVMPISHLETPEVAAQGQAFDVLIVGDLVDGCQQFDRLDVDASASRVVLTMIGTEPDRPQTCTLEGRSIERSHRVVPQRIGSFVVAARQGETGRLTERVVRVE